VGISYARAADKKAMNFIRMRLPAAIALICVASFVTFLQVKANEETDDPVSSSAVWSPDKDDLSEISLACSDVGDYSRCFLDQMESSASSEAVFFSKSLSQQSPSRTGYLKELHEAGIIDVGVVAYPNAGELSQGWMLLNGAPAIVDVDDIGLLPLAAMKQDAQFKALESKYSQINLVVSPEQRKDGAMPQILNLAGGRERFIVDYSLKTPCPSCETIAHASFAFDFDATGKFLGVQFIKVVPDF
jgi:hypothetical protein